MIRLLGRPEIERDGAVAAPPRGHKAWAVLAYVALAERPVPRPRLAGLVFGEAADPLGALRWTLAELRRALGAPDALRGDPLVLDLPAGATLDVLALSAAAPDPALARGELLEGIDAGAGEVFDAWLLVERRRLAAICEAVLHEAALAALAVGAPLDGAALASRALALNAYDEHTHELLVRCLAHAGESEAASRHADATAVLFRRELGREPDAGVRRAAAEHAPITPGAGDRAAVVGQLEAGRAALGAGAVEPGVACLRHACDEARGVGDPWLLGQALLALGTALVHAVRGRDEEGAAMLHEALALADGAGDRETAGKACRELGFVEVQAGRGPTAGRWLLRATELAEDDDERAAVLGVRGMALSDRGHYEAGMAMLRESAALAERCGGRRQAAWSLGLLGRALILRGELGDAAEVLDGVLGIVEAEGWVAFQPFPEALRAEIALHDGEPERAAALLEHAFTLGCRLGDPCWEALAARATGLLHEAAGDRDAALGRLREGVERAIRVPDAYVWVHGYCLDALARVAIDAGEPDARRHVHTLGQVAARAGMRELVVRAALHRARLGDPGGVPAARLLAEAIDNPALHADLLAAA